MISGVSWVVGTTVLLLVFGLAGCDRSESRQEAESKAPTSTSTSSAVGGDEASAEHEDHEIRLGRKMQDIAHRFAAIWYAGRNEEISMLEYQEHELRETADEIEESGVEEHGVDVSARLETDILSSLEKLVGTAKKGEIEAFERRYRATLDACNECHAATEHGFIEVGVPHRNPYANVGLGEATGGKEPSQADEN